MTTTTFITNPPSIQHVWIFDQNRRVYPPTPSGHKWASSGPPIYREHWVKHEVVDETKRSYVTKYGTKVPKTGGRGFALSEREVDLDVWLHDNRHKICRQIEMMQDAELLMKVAELIGYQPDTKI